ncbi:hypothetical protein SBA2_260063 [Acidobacteriia bacterium SbA2]|nr:hypothetical protein SBA2_260063 [Acidobacteriia bacterium SbA2]
MNLSPHPWGIRVGIVLLDASAKPNSQERLKATSPASVGGSDACACDAFPQNSGATIIPKGKVI